MEQGLSAVVACGGKSTRMGVDKAFLRLNGETFLSRIVSELKILTSQVFITVGSKRPEGYVWEAGGPVRIVGYTLELGSPLSGLVAAVDYIETPYFALVGCDMPLIKAELIGYLYSACLGHSAAVPMWDASGVLEPLCAVYHTPSVRLGLWRVLDEGKFRLIDLIATLPDAAYVPTSRLTTVDPDLNSLKNVNTPQEYAFLLNTEYSQR
jgi:molybdopterin-guanine dinucleotide biosynthesis protein A